MRTLHLSRRARLRALTLTLFATPSLAFASGSAHASAATCGSTYTVRPGDSLWSISAACGVPVATIQRLNRLGVYLQPGQVLQLTDPYAPQAYVVQPGDTLSGIALRLGIAPATLAATNGLGNGNLLHPGQILYWRVADQAAATTSTTATTATTTTSASAGTSTSAYTTYLVQPGDTLWGIATARGIAPATLASANGLSNPGLIRAGTVLRIPTTGTGTAPTMQVAGYSATAPTTPATTAAPATTTASTGVYYVKPGDTLWGIAQALGLTPDALAQANGLSLSAPLHPGQALRYTVVVSAGAPAATLADVGSVLDAQASSVGVEDALLKAIAWRESAWRMIDALDGGIGVMQLMPDTVAWLKDSLDPGTWDAHNLVDNIHAGAVLLAFYSKLYNGDVAAIATAYHGGMGAVGAPLTAEMEHYIHTVIVYRQAFLDGIFPYTDN